MVSLARMSTPTSKRTLAHLVHDAERRAGGRVCWHVPDGDGWRPVAMTEIARARDEIAAGLAGRGVERGDRVAVVAPTRFEWVLCDFAILSRGAVTVGVYPTATRDQIGDALRRSRAKVVFVAGAAEAAVVAALRASLPDLAHVVAFEPVEDAHGALPLLRLRAEGRALLADDAAAPSRWRDAVDEDDLATLVFTSGTTGEQKAVALQHRALFDVTRAGIAALGAGVDDVGVAFLPQAHVFARGNVYGGLHSGSTMWIAKSLEDVGAAWQAARPTIVQVVPRVLEKIQAKILAKVAAAPARRRALFARALELGARRDRLLLDGARVPRRLRFAHAVADRVVLRRVRAGLGWDRVRFVLCGGAPLRADVAAFFRAIGVLVLEGWGLTETSAALVVARPDAWRPGSVGKPLPGVSLRVAPDGELLVRSPGLFARYDGDEDATRAAFDDDGWFRTGDVGRVDADGFVHLTDRKKDLFVLAAGKNVAPQAIEAALCADARVAQAIAIGDGRPYVSALIVVDDAHRADAARVAAEAVAAANEKLARYEQVKVWAVVDEPTVEAGTLTPTMKIKRHAVAERYADAIARLYPADASRDAA